MVDVIQTALVRSLCCLGSPFKARLRHSTMELSLCADTWLTATIQENQHLGQRNSSMEHKACRQADFIYIPIIPFTM